MTCYMRHQMNYSCGHGYYITDYWETTCFHLVGGCQYNTYQRATGPCMSCYEESL